MSSYGLRSTTSSLSFFELVFAEKMKKTVERPHFFLQDKDTKLVTTAHIYER